jgi:hypothetical protein
MEEMLAALAAAPEMPAQLPRVSSVPGMRPVGAFGGLDDAFDAAPTFELPRAEPVASAPPPRSRTSEEAAALRRPAWPRPLLAVGAGAAVLVALAIGLLAGSGPGSPPPAAEAPTGSPQTGAEPPPVSEAETAPVLAASADSQAGPARPVGDEDDGLATDDGLVSVHVTTQPEGASVYLAGGGELCADTPCTFEAVRGEEIAIQARLGTRRAQARVAPEQATDLHLVLDVPRSATTQRQAQRRKAKRPHVPEDLKVPEAFRD